MEEIWKDVIGYEGYYKVSNLGNVTSLDRVINYGMYDCSRLFKGALIKSSDNGIGYLQVTLSKNGRKNYLLHRLVALHFIPNTENLPEVNHKDGNKYNCSSSNLEWSSHKCNMIHSVTELCNYSNHPNKLKVGSLNWNSKKVNQCDLSGNFIKSFGSSTEASRETGIDFSSIQKVCLNKRSSAGGFKWEYA